MRSGRLVTYLGYPLIGLVALANAASSPALAQSDRIQAVGSHHHDPAPSSKTDAGPLVKLVKLVRQSTERFRDARVAENENYHLVFGCVSGPEAGAMGLHFANLDFVLDDVLDPARPEIVIYEPMPNGRLRLIGADFLILADVWHATHPPGETPQIMGQLLHLFESPNRFGLPAFYTLHVWAWKDNPNGMFVNWHPKVSCDAFTPQNP
jgi:hypothetical protein